jgi:hypothetical protein
MTFSRCIAITGLMISLVAAAPATQPAADGTIELRAATAFNSGQYGTALPLLRTLEKQLQNQPDKQGMVREQIRVCVAQLAQTAITGGALSPTDRAPDAVPSAEQRKPHAPPKKGETRDLQIKDLGNFEYDADKGGNIPADVKALSGSSIRLHGFMIPIDQAEKITEFALVPSLFACCFGQPPQVQHTIVCKAPSGKSFAYYPDELIVEGTLLVEEKKDEGFIVSIFQVNVDKMQPATK